MKNLIWICVAIICVNCDSGTGSNDSNETNTNALSVGDAFSGFENLSICANDNIEYDYSDDSKVILLSLLHPGVQRAKDMFQALSRYINSILIRVFLC